MENNKKNKNIIKNKDKTLKSNLKNNIVQLVKCPKCNEDIKNNKLKEHLQGNHLTEIIDHIYIGSFMNAKNLIELEKNNIKYILNCASECKNTFEDKIKYLKLDIKDQIDFPIQDYFDKGIQFIIEALNNNDGNILIHCMEGKSRSTAILMAYLIKCKNEDTNSAYKIVKNKRQLTMPNLGFMNKLREFEKEENTKKENII